MEPEVIQTVLNELIEETKEVKKEQALLTKAIESFGENIKEFEEKLQSLEVKTAPIDIKPLVSFMAEKTNEIKNIIASQPKNVIHENRYFFYPEKFWKEHGKQFVNNIITCIFVSFILIALGLIFQYYLRESSEEKKYKEAWQYLYTGQSDKTKNYMDNIIYKHNNDSIRKAHNEITKDYFRNLKKGNKK
jgi:hypothetical protein